MRLEEKTNRRDWERDWKRDEKGRLEQTRKRDQFAVYKFRRD